MADEKSAHRQPEGSDGRVIRVGLGGPKPRPQGVGDGQPVSIPAPRARVEAPRTPSGTPRAPTGHGAFLVCGLCKEEKGLREAATSVNATRTGLGGREKPGGERAERPYRKPTLVGGCKCTKVGERTFVKELGNLTP
jgi:hypothetical protein